MNNIEYEYTDEEEKRLKQSWEKALAEHKEAKTSLDEISQANIETRKKLEAHNKDLYSTPVSKIGEWAEVNQRLIGTIEALNMISPSSL